MLDRRIGSIRGGALVLESAAVDVHVEVAGEELEAVGFGECNC